jgi:trehalose 6-phosphate synthase/phosphatase
MSISDHYQRARHRLILLDYDGTLVDIATAADHATPTPETLNLLSRLASDPANTIVVISGRDRATLEAWLGQLPIGFVAEHGLFIKPHGGSWQPTRAIDESWKPAVRRLMRAAIVPGTFTEEKTLGLVWHYRAADPAAAQPAAARLAAALRPLAAAHHLKVMPGRKIIEVLPDGIDKGAATRRLLTSRDYDFVLAAGDDVTDEDIFRVLPRSAYKIKIGVPGPESAAPAAVPDPATLRRFIDVFSHLTAA